MAVIVLTRNLVDVQAYASELAALGLDVVAMPVTRTVTAQDPDALVRALRDGEYAAIVVTSPRGAQELARAAAQVVRELPEIWAVGPATKRALETANLAAQMPEGVRDGAELATALLQLRQLAGKRVLVPRAEEGRVEVSQILGAAGVDVVLVVAYRTVAVAVDDPEIAAGAELLVGGAAAVCGVFAPSQVTSLVAILRARGCEVVDVAARFCAIGETTAAALRAAGVREVAVAVAPTPEGMAQAIGSVYPPRTP